MIVCSCKNLTCRDIRAAVRHGATTVAQVGRCSGAGTDCGGCRPELRRLIVEARRPAALPAWMPA